MTTWRPVLITSGTLLTALVILKCYGAAQMSSPTQTTLYRFKGSPSDGAQPEAGVTIGRGGVLYGTTRSGGISGAGTVFSLTPPASPGSSWTEAVLYSFTGSGDGVAPNANVVIGSGGVLYGTTERGGTSRLGTVFSLTPPASPGGAWIETVLHSFTEGSDGWVPRGGVVVGNGGVLYGTTLAGGSSNAGTVFSLTPPESASSPWTETVLYNFIGGNEGIIPNGVVIGSGGVLYGTTYTGTGPDSGNGTVYSLTPPTSPGRSWTQTVLYKLTSADCCPYAGVVIGSGGTLYGTAYGGNGAVFSLTPPTSPGGSWTPVVLYSFGCGSDGCNPDAGVAIGSGGILYGTTTTGGSAGNGTVFSLTPPTSPSGAWTHAVLYDFLGGSDGANPTRGTLVG